MLIAKFKAALVEDARDCWRWASIQLAGLGVAIGVAWDWMPMGLKSLLPSWAGQAAAITCFVLIIMARMTKQNLPDRHRGPGDEGGQ